MAYLAEHETGQPDEDEATGTLGPQAHRLPARRVVAPAQEPAPRPPGAAEDHAPHAETQGVAKAPDPGFAEGEEYHEESAPEEPEQPGGRGASRWRSPAAGDRVGPVWPYPWPTGHGTSPRSQRELR